MCIYIYIYIYIHTYINIVSACLSFGMLFCMAPWPQDKLFNVGYGGGQEAPPGFVAWGFRV